MIDPDSYPALTMCRKRKHPLPQAPLLFPFTQPNKPPDYDESLDPPSPPKPAAITLATLASQLSKLQRTADNIEANSYYDPGAGVTAGGGAAAAQAKAAEEAAEGGRRLEEVLREQRGLMHSLRQQGAKVNAIWEELVGRGRFGDRI